VPKEPGNVITPTGSILLPPKHFQLLLVVTHFLEGRQEKHFRLTAVVDEDFCDIPLVNVGDNHHVINVRK
jgi:hypothetical protein